ncbi:MAG: radical SAM protein [Bacteroidales bacterium]|nr:radical SAM protein [Bacteroidales bacterium]
MYRINEIFYSLQGEGFHTGTPAVFVRFSGCNLRCAFCDTQHQAGEMLSLQDIVDEVNKYPNAPLLVLTGGEPSLFIDEAFVAELKQKTGKKIAIETNGTRPLPRNLDWVTFSPKTAFDGGGLEPCVLTHCDELKVVWLGQDLAQYDEIQANYRFLQPCFVEDMEQRAGNMQACIEVVKTYPNWRLSLQIHRVLQIQ